MFFIPKDKRKSFSVPHPKEFGLQMSLHTRVDLDFKALGGGDPPPDPFDREANLVLLIPWGALDEYLKWLAARDCGRLTAASGEQVSISVWGEVEGGKKGEKDFLGQFLLEPDPHAG